MNKRVVITVFALLSVVVLATSAKTAPKKARIKGLVTPLDDDLQCIYANCLEVTLGPGFVGTVKPSNKTGFVKLYPINQEDKSYINNRAYILVKEDQLIYL